MPPRRLRSLPASDNPQGCAATRKRVRFKEGLGLCSGVLRGSFEGKVSAEPLVVARCLFVCLNRFTQCCRRRAAAAR